MLQNIQKFKNEIFKLKQLKYQPELHPLVKEQLKQKILLATASVERQLPMLRLSFQQKLLRYGAVILAGISISAGTVFAAGNSLPGDPLYSVKQLKETVEMQLAANPVAKANLKARHAQIRIQEMDALQNQISSNGLFGNSQKESKKLLQIKARSQAKAAIKEAIMSLKQTQEALEEQGEKDSVTEIKTKIQTLKSEAKQQNLLNAENEADQN